MAGRSIIWSACDENLHSFEHEGQQMTVESYYRARYGFKLQYPHMPLVYVNDIKKKFGGWFPIEFVSQAFAKSKENNEEIVNNILKYHDNIAGTE